MADRESGAPGRRVVRTANSERRIANRELANGEQRTATRGSRHAFSPASHDATGTVDGRLRGDELDEDETGIANVIVRPDLFSEQKRAIVGEPYLLVEGTLQIQEGVTSVKAERVIGLSSAGPEPQSHDFR
ncbi:MAG: hypothetical protein JF613_08490 [Acidobacteria bacterium]|nr:hypothetical protein [Acidobacteriota bacterium]